jgi:hypothetical protein
MSIGHIYLLLNPTMPGYLKIGMTKRTPDERARELSQSSGVAVPYAVAYSEEVLNCEVAESMIHTRLAKFRVNRGREFFHLPLQEAIRELTVIAEEVGRSIPNPTNPTLSLFKDEIYAATEVLEKGLKEDVVPLAGLARQKNLPSQEAPTEAELIDKLPADLQRVYLEMRKRAIAFGPNVVTYATRKNLVFRVNIIFAEIQFQSRKSCLRILIRPEGFNIPENASAQIHGVTVTRVPDSHLWTVNHKIEVDGNSPMDGVEKLLRQSYNAVNVR